MKINNSVFFIFLSLSGLTPPLGFGGELTLSGTYDQNEHPAPPKRFDVTLTRPDGGTVSLSAPSQDALKKAQDSYERLSKDQKNGLLTYTSSSGVRVEASPKVTFKNSGSELRH